MLLLQTQPVRVFWHDGFRSDLFFLIPASSFLSVLCMFLRCWLCLVVCERESVKWSVKSRSKSIMSIHHYYVICVKLCMINICVSYLSFILGFDKLMSWLAWYGMVGRLSKLFIVIIHSVRWVHFILRLGFQDKFHRTIKFPNMAPVFFLSHKKHLSSKRQYYFFAIFGFWSLTDDVLLSFRFFRSVVVDLPAAPVRPAKARARSAAASVVLARARRRRPRRSPADAARRRPPPPRHNLLTTH